jgi:hypothetical protein
MVVSPIPVALLYVYINSPAEWHVAIIINDKHNKHDNNDDLMMMMMMMMMMITRFQSGD